MITARAFAGKHYAVYGLARSGIATVEALLASGARVTAWDDRLCPGEGRDPGQREPLLRSGLDPGLRRGTEIANLNEIDLSQFDSLVVTPGLPLNRHPIAQRAREAGVEIIGDIELFARARPELPPHKVVGITGTNGKSTTTALVHHILKAAGVPTTMGGNIGLPILAQDPLPQGGVYVLELSSYQIDLTQSLDCDVAVLLNITPDHLDRYDSFQAYAASKARLLAMQSIEHPAHVGNHESVRKAVWDSGEWQRRMEPLNQPRVINPKTDLAWALGEGAEQPPALQGPHNLENLLAASLAVANLMLVTPEQRVRAVHSYPGLPHRMERVREKEGVLFVNDSKATNAEAAAPALAAYPEVRWILGGQAKTDSLGDTEAQLGHVVKAYTIGEAGPMFARLLLERGIDVSECESLENAVKMAAEDSQAGEVVLLSPASASFDQFRDFEARGDRFRELVEGL